MPVEDMGRYQKALLWTLAGYDSYGEPTRATSPEEIDVRWEKVNKIVQGSQGQPIAITAEVVVASNLEVPVGSTMWLGGLDDVPGTGSSPESDLMEVITVNSIPDIKGRVYRRTLSLSRISDMIPSTS